MGTETDKYRKSDIRPLPGARETEAAGPGTPEQTHTYQLSFSDPAFRRLVALRDRMGAEDFTQVFRNALKLTELVVEAREQGKELMLRDPRVARLEESLETVDWFED